MYSIAMYSFYCLKDNVFLSNRKHNRISRNNTSRVLVFKPNILLLLLLLNVL